MLRQTTWMLCLLLGLTALAPFGAWAGEETPATDELAAPAVPPGERDPELGALARKPYRPSWAPLPVFRGDVSAVPVLHELLASDDPVERARSAFVLGRIGCPDSVGPLAERLKDTCRDVRVQSGIALACMGDARGVPVCAAAMQTERPWLRYYAVYGLWCVNTSRANGVLRKCLGDHDELVRLTAEQALKTSYVAPPPVEVSGSAESENKPSAQDVWDDAADVLAREADWWWHCGNFDQAVRCLEAGLFMDPESVEGYSSVAWLQWSMGRDLAAVHTLERGIAANPSDPDARFELGHHYYKTKRYVLAREPLAKAIELGGGQLMRRQYAHCLEKLGRLEEALAQWRALLEICPEDGAVRVNYDRVKKLVESAHERSQPA